MRPHSTQYTSIFLGRRVTQPPFWKWAQERRKSSLRHYERKVYCQVIQLWLNITPASSNSDIRSGRYGTNNLISSPPVSLSKTAEKLGTLHNIRDSTGTLMKFVFALEKVPQTSQTGLKDTSHPQIILPSWCVSEHSEKYDATGRKLYIAACKSLDITPVSFFLKNIQEKHLDFKHRLLGAKGGRALAAALEVGVLKCKNARIVSIRVFFPSCQSDASLRGQANFCLFFARAAKRIKKKNR